MAGLLSEARRDGEVWEGRLACCQVTGSYAAQFGCLSWLTGHSNMNGGPVKCHCRLSDVCVAMRALQKQRCRVTYGADLGKTNLNLDEATLRFV